MRPFHAPTARACHHATLILLALSLTTSCSNPNERVHPDLEEADAPTVTARPTEAVAQPPPPALAETLRQDLVPTNISPKPATPEVAEPGLEAHHAPEEGFIVHEWGTFTSVQTSRGVTLGRMYEEDEPHPGFVHRFQPDDTVLRVKGISTVDPEAFRILESATQRLETPVLYFYGAPNGQRVEVTVDFPQGVVSEWFPGSTNHTPTQDDFAYIGGGSMTWEVSLLHRTARMIPVPDDDVWSPARDVAAMTVKHDEEEEPFIFYRGVGAFDFPVRTTSARAGQLTVMNGSSQPLPAVFVYDLDDRGASLYPLGRLEPGQSLEHDPDDLDEDVRGRAHHDVTTAKAALVDALVDAGLYHDEAVSMIETWDRSYFETRGTRVLYIVPRAWTDGLLPLTVKPTPDGVTRVLIGRIEVTPATQELALEQKLRTYYDNGVSYDVIPLHTLLDTTRVEHDPRTPVSPALLPRLHGLQRAHDGTMFGTWLFLLVHRRHEELPVLKRPNR